MKRTLTTAISLALLAGSATIGCGTSNDVQSEESLNSGNVHLRLLGSAADGTVYRLRTALFDITGPEAAVLDTELDPDATSVNATLAAGHYQAELLAGWQLERDEGGLIEIVDATLISPNPVAFSVLPEEVTNLVFQFEAAEDVIVIGDGELSIAIDVTETVAPLDCVFFDPTTCPANYWCAPPTEDPTLGGQCIEEGPLTIGQSCDASDPSTLCQEGLVCIDVGLGAGQTCVETCDLSAPTCSAGLTCTDVGIEPAGTMGLCAL